MTTAARRPCAPRSALVQAIVVYLVAIVLKVHIRWEPQAMLVVAVAVFLGSCTFSTFSLLIAWIVKTRERFMGIGQVLTMPLFFALAVFALLAFCAARRYP